MWPRDLPWHESGAADRAWGGGCRVPAFSGNQGLCAARLRRRMVDGAPSLAAGENQGPAGFRRETSREMNAGPRTGLRRWVPCPRPSKSGAFVPGVTTTSGPTALRDALVARSTSVAVRWRSPA